MSPIPNRLKLSLIASACLVAGLFTSTASAQLTFTVDTFTTEKLQITFQTGVSLTGSVPASSRSILYITADSFNKDWILKDNSALLVGSTASLGGIAFSSGMAESQAGTRGDFVSVSFGNFASGSSFDAPLTLTMGHLFSGGFDPTAVSNLVLTWGLDGLTPNVNPWGEVQSTTAVSAVPEPSTFGLLLGLAAIGMVSSRRRSRL